MTVRSQLVAAFIVMLIAAFCWAATMQSNVRAQSGGDAVTSNRYQVSAWSYPASERSAGLYGAYIVDSRTGEVWSVVTSQKPRKLGAAK